MSIKTNSATQDQRIAQHELIKKRTMMEGQFFQNEDDSLSIKQIKTYSAYPAVQKVVEQANKPINPNRRLAVFINSQTVVEDTLEWMDGLPVDSYGRKYTRHALKYNFFYKGVKQVPLRVYDGDSIKVKEMKTQISYLFKMAIMGEEFECVTIFCQGFKDGMKKAGSLAKHLKKRISVIKVRMHGEPDSIGEANPYSSTDLKSLHDDINDETMEKDGVFDLSNVCLTGKVNKSTETCFAKELAHSMKGKKVFACKEVVCDPLNSIVSLNPYKTRSLSLTSSKKEITKTFHYESNKPSCQLSKPKATVEPSLSSSEEEEKEEVDAAATNSAAASSDIASPVVVEKEKVDAAATNSAAASSDIASPVVASSEGKKEEVSAVNSNTAPVPKEVSDNKKATNCCPSIISALLTLGFVCVAILSRSG